MLTLGSGHEAGGELGMLNRVEINSAPTRTRAVDPTSLCLGSFVTAALVIVWDRCGSAPEPWLIAGCGVLLFAVGQVLCIWVNREPSLKPAAVNASVSYGSQLLSANESFGICLLHSQRGILDANPAFRKLLGYGTQQSWDERGMEFHLQREWWQSFVQSVLADGQVIDRSTEVVTFSGRSVMVDVGAHVVERREDVWVMEVTLRERKAPEDSLSSRHQDHERYARLILNLQEVVFDVNQMGLFEFLNPAWKSLVGREPRECLGQSMSQFACLEDQEEVGSLLQQLRDRRQDFFYRDLRFSRQPGGEERWAACFIQVRLDAHGEALGMSGTLIDVTERKELELSLRGAREEAECASKAKNDFLAVMSHEIRTPMNGVLGLTYLLLETPLNEEQKDLAATIQSSGQTLLALLNDLLDFSRIEGGSLRLDSDDFVVRELLQRSTHLLSTRAQEKKLAVELSIAEGLPATVTGDAARFQQVILNFVGNAIKFTDTGSVTVRAYQSQLPQGETAAQGAALHEPPPLPGNAPWICVAVSDTGIGLAPEQQRGLFEKFSQVDSSATRRFGGVGLGLAISKSLVELMGGRIGFTSQFGKGSVFWFAIPNNAEVGAGYSTDTEVNRRRERARRSLVPTPDLSGVIGLRVLIAEDNPTNARLIEGLLQKRGFITEIARNGRTAVDRVLTQGFDLVLMDCDMPEMDGITATLAIRQAESARAGSRRVPVIALTANAMNSDRERCIASGMDDFLTKPLNVKSLERALERWLKPAVRTTLDMRSF